MPHHPKEENTEGSKCYILATIFAVDVLAILISMANIDLTDKVAKESKDSTASDHALHNEDHSHATSGGKARAQDHHSKVRSLTS